MDPEPSARLATLEIKIDTMYASVDKLRKYFLWTGIISIVLFVVPLIGLVFAIPSFLKSYSSLDSLDSTSSNSIDSLNQINSLLQ